MAYQEGQYEGEVLAEHREGRHAEEIHSDCTPCTLIEEELAEAHEAGKHQDKPVALCWVCDLPSLKSDYQKLKDLGEREAWDEQREKRRRSWS